MKDKAAKTKNQRSLSSHGHFSFRIALFIFGAASNFYRYLFLKISLDIFLAVPSTIGSAILLVFIIAILVSYLDKRKVLRSFQDLNAHKH